MPLLIGSEEDTIPVDGRAGNVRWTASETTEIRQDDHVDEVPDEYDTENTYLTSDSDELGYGYDSQEDVNSDVLISSDEEEEDDEEERELIEEEQRGDAELTDTDNEEVVACEPSLGLTKVPRSHSAITRELFQDRLQEFENPVDLQLLYPPSLVYGMSNIDDKDSESDFLCEAFARSENTKNSTGDPSRVLRLKDFCVYNDLSHKQFGGQFESLHNFSIKCQNKLLLDGIVFQECHQIVITGAVITDICIGGLNPVARSCHDQVWIQTKESASMNCWYRLTEPQTQYEKIWTDFIWINNFSKYCIDYFVLGRKQQFSIALDNFIADFKKQIIELHGNSPAFKSWDEKSGHRIDFRRHFSLFGRFIRRQYCSLGTRHSLENDLIWQEVGLHIPEVTHIKEQTIVTSNVATTFSQSLLGWGSMLTQVATAPEVENKRRDRMRSLQIPDKFRSRQDVHFKIDNCGAKVSRVEWTLAEASRRDRPVSHSWEALLNKLVVIKQLDKNRAYFDFALVKEISPNKKNVRVIWLTLPANTICVRSMTGNGKTFSGEEKAPAYYPIGNELFFSDDCNCYTVDIRHIYGVYNISVGSPPASDDCHFFVMTWYQEKEHCFVNTAKHIVRTCSQPCFRSISSCFHMGQDGAHRRQNNPGEQMSPINCGESVSESGFEDILPNVSLFTGCGLFDRALESGGAIKTLLSIDCNQIAMCSAKANSRDSVDSREPKFINKSVNTVLHKIMSGDEKYVHIGCLSAGSPCPGFSSANRYKGSDKSLRDCSLLASVISWIEILLPVYCVIENVPAMDSGSPSACCQAIAFLVAMGYQVRKLLLNANDYGGSTIRRRLFVVATAPSYTLPSIPKSMNSDHGNPISVPTIGNTVSDLSIIHNDILANIKEPYHIPARRLTPNIAQKGPNYRDILSRIPHDPPGQGLVDNVQRLTCLQRKWFRSLTSQKQELRSQCMRRVKADEQFRSVVTSVPMLCANQGRLVHYSQDRLLSLEELARAQGVPANFVLVGNMAQQIRQIGNAVPWCLGAAIGKEISRSFLLSRNSTRSVNGDSQTETPGPTDIQTVNLATGGREENNNSRQMISEAEYREAKSHVMDKLKILGSSLDRSNTFTETNERPNQRMKRPYSFLREGSSDRTDARRIKCEHVRGEEIVIVPWEDCAEEEEEEEEGEEEEEKDCHIVSY